MTTMAKVLERPPIAILYFLKISGHVQKWLEKLENLKTVFKYMIYID